MTTLWDTTGSDVVRALSAERRLAGAVSTGLALTLVVVVRESDVPAAEAAATAAAAEHPLRLILVVRRRPETPEPRLDAEVTIGGRLGPGEAVVLRMNGRLALHAESVVLPLLAADTPVVTWWHGRPPRLLAHDPLGVFAERRITDCARAPDPLAALRTRAEDFAPGDTDLAWTRATPWRSMLAAAFDTGPPRVHAARVSADAGNPTAALLAGWLTSRLRVSVERTVTRGPGVTEVEISGYDENDQPVELCLTRPDGHSATLTRTGAPDRMLPLLRHEPGELLAEELRRLDADGPYADALAAATDTAEDLLTRPSTRQHVWEDPATTPDPDLEYA